MKKIIFLFVFLFAGSVNASIIIASPSGLASPGSLITFDEFTLPTDSSVTNEYSSLGITFTGLLYDPSCCIETWTPEGSSPYLGNTLNGSTGTDWTILFSDIQTEVAFTLAAVGTTMALEAYLNNSLVETFNFSSSIWGYYGFTNIVFDEIRMGVNGSAMLIDNLQFSSSASVPEPTSLALLGLGLAGFVFSIKKKKA